MAELMFEKGFLKGRSIKVPEGRFLIVGRAKEAGLPLPDPQLSRRHCKITHSPEGIVMEDLGSRNGTYVNGQAITTVKLKHGDEIVFGDQTAKYLNPSDLQDSSGEYESEEAEATREIPELQPGQAMLLNPPNIVRGPDSRPPSNAPVPPPTRPPLGVPLPSSGLLPAAEESEDELDAQLPQIDETMPQPEGLDESIESDLSAPLPNLPANTISMEETMVHPRAKADTTKAPAPPSKIKKLMDSYKAEVMSLKKDDVKPVPKAKPATVLHPKNADGTDMKAPADPAAPARKESAKEGAKLAPTAAPTVNQKPQPQKGTPGASDAQWENENKIEAFLEAADETLTPGAARAETTESGRDPVKAKTIPLPPERTRAAQAGQALRELNDAMIEEDLAEEAEVIGDSPVAEPTSKPPETVRLTPRPDETGPIDTSTIAGANDEIVIDSSRIDRHREIADEIFRAAQTAEPADEEGEESDVIEEVDEDFDLDSLEPVAAPTLDLGQLDRTENTAGSGTAIEVVDGSGAPEPPAESKPVVIDAKRPTPAATTMGRQITPMPILPPIVAEAHVDSIGPNEIYSYCDALFEEKKRGPRTEDRNLLAPILAKNEEYSAPGQ
ncbi:MAG TPA: FHA domain-containing protein [Planctomycetota bacterium]|nr:FHA domain-containing protein [Planctomycetota bacterium]